MSRVAVGCTSNGMTTVYKDMPPGVLAQAMKRADTLEKTPAELVDFLMAKGASSVWSEFIREVTDNRANSGMNEDDVLEALANHKPGFTDKGLDVFFCTNRIDAGLGAAGDGGNLGETLAFRWFEVKDMRVAAPDYVPEQQYKVREQEIVKVFKPTLDTPLGIYLFAINPPTKVKSKMIVANLEKDGIIAEAGIHIGDQLVAINGVPVPYDDKMATNRVLRSLEGEIELTIMRNVAQVPMAVRELAKKPGVGARGPNAKSDGLGGAELAGVLDGGCCILS